MAEARRYQYLYAVLDPETNMCVEIRDTTQDMSAYPEYIPIPEYNSGYIMKYYIDGSWYLDAAGTQPWSPA